MNDLDARIEHAIEPLIRLGLERVRIDLGVHIHGHRDVGRWHFVQRFDPADVPIRRLALMASVDLLEPDDP
jgi:hypothetical protein